MIKTTLVVGASPHPYRYAYLAVQRLQEFGQTVYAFGIRPGMIADVPILTQRGEVIIPGLDTLSLYLHQRHHTSYTDWFFALQPRRIIFNPGSENRQLAKRLESQGIEVVHGCTLVMLSAGTY